MTDTLGWRRVYGIATPSTNTVVQPEYDAMRPVGVTNHVEGMHIPDDPLRTGDDGEELIRRIDAALENAVDRLATCRPDHIVLGISAESIWGGGLEPARRIAERIRARAGDLPVTQAADALPAALKAVGVGRRVAVVDPYSEIAEGHLAQFFDEAGFELVRCAHVPAKSPTLIAHTTDAELIGALRKADGDDVEAIVQFGANLPAARLMGEAERWLGKPVIAVNTATYWHALRSDGIQDKVQGFGSLLSHH
ncbi:maleate isomerase [Thermocatellispora tengchongensis]|uniref:Maleate isomerase n=1 Tax=Thermocatellispora tengchongensis TaxID=1073253 RepID=A0A840PLE0_9ACTN|nr:IgiC [Thermocatellispora tengchongensis]MBB5137877.1 maleate isomerase [Thermocatellispora tengchongensis]